MHFSMNEIGYENIENIKSITAEAEKWQFLYNAAKDYGFEGIHIKPSLYNSFNLDIDKIPEYFREFKLTCHFGRLCRIISFDEYKDLDNKLKKCFEIAIKNNFLDISIHPPNINGLNLDEKKRTLEFFHKIIKKWVTISTECNVSLSLETHVSEGSFLFNGLNEYIGFINEYPNLGVLIDISHNYYDKYSEEGLFNSLSSKNIKGLHISDAVQGVDIEKGTHLAIGDGNIDFNKFMKLFNKIPILYGALEIKTKNEDIRKSLNRMKNIVKGSAEK